MADVLVVDDDGPLAEAVADVLVEEGHAVRIAADGVEGLRCLNERLSDLIVLDVEMPALSGPEMAVQMIILDAGRERIPVVLLSGVADLSAVAAAVGTPYALAKPCTLDALVRVTREALRARVAPRPRITALSANAHAGANH
jgi:DNA-binding NtrC family response regulator